MLKNVSLRGKKVDVLIEGNKFKKISKNIDENAKKKLLKVKEKQLNQYFIIIIPISL